MSNRRLTLKDSRGVEHAFVYWRGPREPVADLAPEETREGMGLKSWEQVVADVEALGVPLCNLTVSRGWSYDYGFPWVDTEGRPLHADIDGVTDGEWVELYGWRVFAELDTGAGLAHTEDGDMFSLDAEKAQSLTKIGWRYEGSAMYRVEVQRETLPADERGRLADQRDAARTDGDA